MCTRARACSGAVREFERVPKLFKIWIMHSQEGGNWVEEPPPPAKPQNECFSLLPLPGWLLCPPPLLKFRGKNGNLWNHEPRARMNGEGVLQWFIHTCGSVKYPGKRSGRRGVTGWNVLICSGCFWSQRSTVYRAPRSVCCYHTKPQLFPRVVYKFNYQSAVRLRGGIPGVNHNKNIAQLTKTLHIHAGALG